MTGIELCEAHVRAFNEGVRTGDWEPMLSRFADDATVSFENAPAGRIDGIEAIRTAYRDSPPDDEIRLLGVQDDPERGTVTAAFAWTRGGTGRMVLETARGQIRALTVIFD